MGARTMTVGVLLLAVGLVGCGDSRPSAVKAMDAKFQRIDYRMGNLETINAPSGPYLEQATQQYIALVREYARQLGPDEAKRRLVDKGNEVGPYCLPCVATLADEARRY